MLGGKGAGSGGGWVDWVLGGSGISSAGICSILFPFTVNIHQHRFTQTCASDLLSADPIHSWLGLSLVKGKLAPVISSQVIFGIMFSLKGIW